MRCDSFAPFILRAFSRMRIAIDAMGGDHAPDQIVQGAVQAARDFDLEVILVGDETAIRRYLPDPSGPLPRNVEIVHTTHTVAMDEAPMQALKQKIDHHRWT